MRNEKKMLCNLVVPGAGKSGTSSLHSYLQLHPEICMSSIKEPQFFSVDKQWKKGFDWHNELFKSLGNEIKIYGESSTTYFASEVSIDRISLCLNDPKIIILLRNPVKRVISHYNWMYALGLESEKFRYALINNGNKFNPNFSYDGNYKSYIELSNYSVLVPKWINRFGRENVLVLSTDLLSENPVVTLSICFKFLNVSPYVISKKIIENKTNETFAKKEPLFSKTLRLTAPRSVVKFAKYIFPSIVNVWDDLFIKKFKIYPPEISSDDLLFANDLLRDDILFYNNIIVSDENNYIYEL